MDISLAENNVNTFLKKQKYYSFFKKIEELWSVYLFGGFVRDVLLDIPPNDIDLIICATEEELFKEIPYAQKRINSIGKPIYNFTVKDAKFEITLLDKDISVESYFFSQHSFLTINSLYIYKGRLLPFCYPFLQDYLFKRFQPVSFVYTNVSTKIPAISYLKLIRLLSYDVFDIDPRYLSYLITNKDTFYENTQQLKNLEGYQLFSGPYPLNSLYYLGELGIIPQCLTECDVKEKEILIPKKNLSLPFILTYYAFLFSEEFSLSVIDTFEFSKKIAEDFQQFYQYAHNQTGHRRETPILKGQKTLLNHLLDAHIKK